MFPDRFDNLRERLLRAGIAPRHVRRYISELRDHFDDLVQEEAGKGLALDAAARAAHARIGSDDELSAVVLARPGLRSISARFPWTVFGLGPALLLTTAVVLAVLLEGAFLYLHLGFVRWWTDTAPDTPPDSIKLLISTWNWLITYAAPLMIAALLCALAIRQRMSGRWVLLGAAVVCILGAFHEVAVHWSDLPFDASSNPPPDRSHLSVTLALLPPFPQWLITEGLFRAAINAVLVSAGYWWWIRREARLVRGFRSFD